MMTQRQETALKNLREAIKSAGGVVSVATRADIPQSYLSTMIWGKRAMGRDSAAKLRPLIDLGADDWVEILVPAPDAPGEGEAVQA